ncbi:FAD-binding oxidoreductase [Oceanospirillaceae bacterium]|jgi:FAD/FMN-containing dehydrogenase/Fe-S oxidoreductase|nr:FAD-binding oxidoreductase [Oceanospirillaceae bacterium]|tara:strand:- start:276 stop:3182 length:2907 start_codon:yes stop_codon:yes gene_type:complete
MPNEPIYHAHLKDFYAQLTRMLQGECDFSAAGVALYTTDASNYRQVPLGVVYPHTVDDLVNTATLCKTFSLPVLLRGGGTSQNGQGVNEAVVVDCSRYLTRVLDIDVENQTALVDPGVICDALKQHAEVHGLTFGPDPGTHSRCTLGGMIGNNSCGPHSMLAGKTVENVLQLEILTSDGARFWVGPTSDQELEKIVAGTDRRAAIYRELVSIRDEYQQLIRQRYPNIKRRVSGYNLDQLLPENGFNVARALVGSEGTCVTVLQARVKLIEKPLHTRLIVLGFEDIYTAGDSVAEILPFAPIAMEGLDWGIIGGLKERNLKQAEIALLPEGQAWLMVELSGNSAENLTQLCHQFETAMGLSKKVKSVLSVVDAANTAAIWSIREQGASATAMSLHVDDPDPVVGWEDTAVDPLQLGDYLREFSALIQRYGYTSSLYGHFGDGCIHARITFDTRSAEGISQWRKFSVEIAELVVQFGGSLSGEHGDGQAKGEFLPVMFGPELMYAFRRFKQIWDPEQRMNPGKLIDAYKMDENLRYGADYKLPETTTILHFKDDVGGFSRATERCIGMGKCRAQSGAMCPSYQATQEEKYSTRGRAHLLHEMVRGEVIKDGWDNKAIVDSFEHCLSCKACKTECPTQVDIATYKAEFLAAHYAHKRRPLNHYPLAYIGNLLPKISRFSWVFNKLQAGITGQLAQKFLGLSDAKGLPKLASQSFTSWVKKHAHRQDQQFHWFGAQDQPTVVLWADSVNNHYRPALLQSAVNVLLKSGHQVAVAKQHFCCGRPLYEYGFLAQALKQLTVILESFHCKLPAGCSVIVLEPSCLSVFKDELLSAFPEDTRALDLRKRAKTLTRFLSESSVTLAKQLNSGILHLHCHDKSLGISSHEREWMLRCFKDLQEPESGCCGMAGTYGLKKQTRAIGQRLYERRLKPAIDNAANNAVVVANGFSCYEQMMDGQSDRWVLHPVEIIEKCLQ